MERTRTTIRICTETVHVKSMVGHGVARPFPKFLVRGGAGALIGSCLYNLSGFRSLFFGCAIMIGFDGWQ